ncbi:hypothetical protein SEA_DOGFISH_7 [Gordonia phage Dogfish]|nr:hypothetical protein SEA_DOGFISH_7 [Gordonia phage Dogfish]
MTAMTTRTDPRAARLDALYDAALDAVSLPDEDIWPGSSRVADPEGSLHSLIGEITRTGQRIPADVADQIVSELPEYAEIVAAVRGGSSTRRAS